MRLAKPVALNLAILTVVTFASSLPQSPAPVAHVFHPSGPLPSFEVATVKPSDPNVRGAGQPIRAYIMNAYRGDFALTAEQVIGGPAWIDKDPYAIDGKVPDQLSAAIQKMGWQDQANQRRMLMQSLLADRFHLKLHFETRELPVYALVPGKGGLKITPVSGPDPTAPPAPYPDSNQPPPPGRSSIQGIGSLSVMDAGAITMRAFINLLLLRNPEYGDRPLVDETGFSGCFNITDLRWQPLGRADAPSNIDAPSLESALEGKLGIRLVTTRAPVEVLVIDSIDRPSEN